MRQSTVLTRHFASQGLKIKLRQDGTGRSGRGKKAQPAGQDATAQSRRLDIDTSYAKSQKTNSLSRPRKSSQGSPTTPSAATFSMPPSPTQRTFSSVSTISNGLNPYRSYGGSFATRYSMSSADSNHVSSVVPSTTTLSPRSSAFGFAAHPEETRNYPHSRPGTISNITKQSSDDTVSTIDNALDPQGIDISSTSAEKRQSLTIDRHCRYPSPSGIDLPKPKMSGSTTDTTRKSLPSINTAMQQSSVWLKNANLVPADDVAGGITFRNGIRYGGDDGSLPPMSFGKLPNLIYEGIIPGTPSVYSGNDLSNFSLKNGSGSLALTPYSLINGSAPATPNIPLNHDLTQYVGQDHTNGHRSASRLETRSRPDYSSRLPPTCVEPEHRGHTACKPSQFADLDENLDAASAQGLLGFSSALSSSLECKVKNFNLALPRRTSRGPRGSLDEQPRGVPMATRS